MMNPLLLHEAFFAASARVPRGVAVSHNGACRTYAEITDGTQRIARALAAAGIRRGARIVWWGGTSLDLVPMFLATASLGAVFAPLNPNLKDHEAQTLLDLADPQLVVVDEQHRGDLHLTDLVNSTVTTGIENCQPQETDDHVMYFTSGTTGTSKAVALSHRTTMLRSLAGLSTFPCGPHVCMFPLFHMAGWTSAIGHWLVGDEVVFADGGDAEGLALAIEQRRAHSFYAIPAVWRRMLDLGLDHFDLSSLAVADTGTSATTVELLAAIHDALPHTTTTITYGSTEVGGACRLSFRDLFRKPDSVGPPVPGVFVRLENGELWVKSPFLFQRYFRNPEATEFALVNGWYRTGELAQIDTDGYVSIVGRVSDMIRSGGETVAPAEVDLVLQKHPAVLDGAVAGVSDETWGEIVTAFVVLRPGASLSLAEIQAHCRGHLARYKIPRGLVILDSIPRTGATRQVQRQTLASLA